MPTQAQRANSRAELISQRKRGGNKGKRESRAGRRAAPRPSRGSEVSGPVRVPLPPLAFSDAAQGLASPGRCPWLSVLQGYGIRHTWVALCVMPSSCVSLASRSSGFCGLRRGTVLEAGHQPARGLPVLCGAAPSRCAAASAEPSAAARPGLCRQGRWVSRVDSRVTEAME